MGQTFFSNQKTTTMKKQTTLFLAIFITTFQFVNAQEISTVAEIYGFEVGDEFHFNEEFGNLVKVITNIKINSKIYSHDSDTLIYLRHVDSVYINLYDPDSVYSNYIDTVVYTRLDSLVNFREIDTVYSNPEYFNGRLVNRADYEQPPYIYSYIDFVVGCGIGCNYWSDVQTSHKCPKV